MLPLAGAPRDQAQPAAAAHTAQLRRTPAAAARGSPASSQASSDGAASADVGSDPRRGGLRYDVFICHAGPQKDGFAVWLQKELRISGRRAFLDEPDLQYGNDAPAVMETALRTASVVVAVITKDFLRSKCCLRELVWACDEHRRPQQEGQQPLGILPVFYRSREADIGFGPDRFKDAPALRRQLDMYHGDAGEAEREDWLHALLFVSTQTGARQDSVGRRARVLVWRAGAEHVTCERESEALRLT